MGTPADPAVSAVSAVTAPEPPPPPLASRGAWYALGLLTLVYVLNFLDRSLIYILFTPIKREIALSDLQLALLGSTSFVIFYTVLGIPFGRLADRHRRTHLIAGGLAVWSLFSGLTGFADGFAALFACRVMVGVGEATLGPAAISLLSDFFPPRQRATVQAIYSSGIALGSAASFFLGGVLGEALGWRWGFYLLGFPGLLVAVAVALLREPARGATEAVRATAPPAGDPSTGARTLLRNPVLRWHHLGYALLTIATNSSTIWVPSFLVRVHGLGLAEAGQWMALSVFVGGLPGTLLGGYLADRFRARWAGGRMYFGATAALIGAPFWLLLLFSEAPAALIVANAVLLATGLSFLGGAAADVSDLAGPKQRGLAIAIYYFTVNAIGYGLAPPLIGALSDALGAATDPAMLRYALLVCPLALLLSALGLWRGAALRQAVDDSR